MSCILVRTGRWVLVALQALQTCVPAQALRTQKHDDRVWPQACVAGRPALHETNGALFAPHVSRTGHCPAVLGASHKHARLDHVQWVCDGGGHQACDHAADQVQLDAVLPPCLLHDGTLDLVICRTLSCSEDRRADQSGHGALPQADNAVRIDHVTNHAHRGVGGARVAARSLQPRLDQLNGAGDGCCQAAAQAAAQHLELQGLLTVPSNGSLDGGVQAQAGASKKESACQAGAQATPEGGHTFVAHHINAGTDHARGLGSIPQSVALQLQADLDNIQGVCSRIGASHADARGKQLCQHALGQNCE
mmetsp:Transcript_33340/g.73718  ORF Transcript_33340/g.73718 Transcript_33340/m.73718 type:complete len:306 (-) Transcript_33340:423-1340(-)